MKNSLLLPFLDTVEGENIDCDIQHKVCQNDEKQPTNDVLNIQSTEKGKINAIFQKRELKLEDCSSNTNVVCTSAKSEKPNAETIKKTSQRKKNIKRMHANLSGTKYVVGMNL